MENDYKIQCENILGRPICRWEDDIKMNLKKTGWEAMDWIHVTRDNGTVERPM
jgi:hypothetical protein